MASRLLSARSSGFVLARLIAGIVLSIVAINQIKQTREDGRGLAIAGIAIGALSLIVGLIFFVVALSNGGAHQRPERRWRTLHSRIQSAGRRSGGCRVAPPVYRRPATGYGYRGYHPGHTTRTGPPNRRATTWRRSPGHV
jgi:hypothetical protein